MKTLYALWSRARTFGGDTKGSVAVIYAAAALLIIGFMALAVDGARAHILRSQLHYAVDAAAIAIGKQMKQRTDAELLALAEKYIRANVSPSLLGLTEGFSAGDLTVEMLDGGDDNIKEIRATAKLRTAMLGMLDGASTVDIGKSAMVRREIRGLELALSLDTTGSMEWSSGTVGVTRMEALKSSATDLLDILFDGATSNDKLWVAVVPFTRQVQAKTDVSWVKSSTMTNIPLPTPYSYEHFEWKNVPDFPGGVPFCFGSRTATGHDDDAVAPSSEGLKFEADYEYQFTYRGYWDYKYQYYVEAVSGYRCPIAEVLPLTNVKSEIVAHMNSLTPHGGTATDRGAVWGWRAVSENWRGYWDISDASRPFDGDAPLNTKVVVLMTDGENSYSSSDGRLTTICNNMKADGITVVTINFATPTSLYPLYESCASSPDLFFPAPTATQLQSAFEAIALQLSVLRLIQ